MKSTTRPESVFLGRDNVLLTEMLDFYSFPGALILDCTANKRRMWKGIECSPSPVFMDIDETVKPDVVGDFCNMPFEAESFDLIVFDPPHLPVASASPASLPQMGVSYGLDQAPNSDNISSYFTPFLKEAKRILRPDGLIFAKLKDYVHNHKYQWTLSDWIVAVKTTPGLTPCDLRIKRDPCGGNLKSSRWKKTHHARVVHCWWAVVRKGKCEQTTKVSTESKINEQH